MTRVKGGHRDEGSPLSFISGFCDYHYLPPNASAFPLGLTQKKTGDTQDDWFSDATANLSPTARAYLAALALPDPDTDPQTAELIWLHALAIGYSPAYLSDNADGIRENWPRIPLPASRAALLASAALGREVAALLDTETQVPGVTSGPPRPELKPIAVISRTSGGALTPAEFALTAGWGSGGQGAITMPGKGKTEARAPQPGEQAEAFGSAPTLDIYLNATAYWKNVPQPVWDFTIGGYQVMEKMAQLPRAARAGPRPDGGRNWGSDRHGAASGSAGAAATPAGRQPPGSGKRNLDTTRGLSHATQPPCPIGAVQTLQIYRLFTAHAIMAADW